MPGPCGPSSEARRRSRRRPGRPGTCPRTPAAAPRRSPAHVGINSVSARISTREGRLQIISGGGFTVGVAWLIMSAISPRKSPIPDSCGRGRCKAKKEIRQQSDSPDQIPPGKLEYDEIELGRVVYVSLVVVAVVDADVVEEPLVGVGEH